MLALQDKKQAVKDRRRFLIRELYRFGLTRTSDGRNFEAVKLADLERQYISERCRMANIMRLQERSWEYE